MQKYAFLAVSLFADDTKSVVYVSNAPNSHKINSSSRLPSYLFHAPFRPSSALLSSFFFLELQSLNYVILVSATCFLRIFYDFSTHFYG